MAAHGRKDITTKTIRRLQRQKYELTDIVLVGDSIIERDIAKKTDCKYVSHSNMPLSDKWQAGVDFARELNPDSIVICGSDSWYTNNWIKRCAKHITEGYDLVGTIFFNTCKAYPNEKLRIIQRRYVGKRALEPVGSGRAISARILDKFNWKLFPVGLKSGLDKPSYDKIVEYGGKIKIVNHDIKGLGIKSTWDTLNPWKDNFRSKPPIRIIKEFSNPENWLDRFFDRAVKDLIDIIPKIIIKR